MPSYPTAPVVFPARADGATIFAEHMNAVQDEVAAIEAALLQVAGQTNADIRLRKIGNALEWGHPNAGYGNVLASDASALQGFIGFNCEAGTNPGTYRTRGVSGLVVKGIAGIMSASYVAAPNADNQALLEYFRVDTQGATFPQLYAGRQGHFTDIAYNAGNFAASTGAWGVDVGDQLLLRYTLVGKVCTLAFNIQTTDLTAGAIWLRISLPVALTAARLTKQIGAVITNAGAVSATPGMMQTNAGEGNLYIFRDAASTAYSITAADNLGVQGTAIFEVN